MDNGQLIMNGNLSRVAGYVAKEVSPWKELAGRQDLTRHVSEIRLTPNLDSQ